MIYGINFTNEHIPAHVAKRFAQAKRCWRFWHAIGLKLIETTTQKSHNLRLQGVCNTMDEVNVMVLTADNGHRRIHYVGPRRIAEETWYAVYCS